MKCAQRPPTNKTKIAFNCGVGDATTRSWGDTADTDAWLRFGFVDGCCPDSSIKKKKDLLGSVAGNVSLDLF